MTVTQSESGMVTRTRTKETKVRIVAQIPGPSSSAEKEGRSVLGREEGRKEGTDLILKSASPT